MKKTLLLVLVLALLLAFAPSAHAATIPAEKITISVQAVDYVSALAGIAKPTSAEHHENERFAALLIIDVPSWYDTSNMSMVVDSTGLSVESALPGTVATGNYLIFGTLFSNSASMKITLQDNAIELASTAQELWAALYGDRSVSATLSFSPITASTTGVTTTPIIVIPPQTGDAPALLAPLLLTAGVVVLLLTVRLRRKAATQ